MSKQGESDKDYKGYCDIENLYVQWFALKSNRYLLFLTNGNEYCYLFFTSSTFWVECQSAMAQYMIQLDFKEQYEVIDQIGKGSFSKVNSWFMEGVSCEKFEQ